MNASSQKPAEAPLAWARMDIERRLLFPGRRNTEVSSLLTWLCALAATLAFYGVLYPFRASAFSSNFYDLGPTPYVIVFFSAWCLAILFFKRQKLSFQKRALRYSVIPDDPHFVLSPSTVDLVVDRIYQIVDEPRNSMLFNRITVALANLRNLGRVGDVDEILNSQADRDEANVDTSYSLLTGLVWAIPVLGFIGTVLGLSDAIGSFNLVLGDANDMETIKAALRQVTGGLSVAFVTTLQALVAALAIQILLTFQRKAEYEFLEDCSRYCAQQIVNRLRIVPFERTAEA